MMIKTMHVGEERSYKRIITKEDVLKFGELTGDMNQAHFDADYCSRTPFKEPIVHGMLIGSLFSKIFGTEYPGEGTIYCGQSLKISVEKITLFFSSIISFTVILTVNSVPG